MSDLVFSESGTGYTLEVRREGDGLRFDVGDEYEDVRIVLTETGALSLAAALEVWASTPL